MKTLLLRLSLGCFVGVVAGSYRAALGNEAMPAKVAPIQIDNCRLDYNVGSDSFLGAFGKSTGALMIKFTNESNQQIDVARFAVDLDGKTASIRDVGKFAPGITVDHKFKDFAGKVQWVLSRQPQPKCRVTFVKFADGTAWGEEGPDGPQGSPAPTASP